MRNVRVDAGLTRTIERLAGDLLRELSAARVVIAAREKTTARAFLWTAERAPQDTSVRLDSSALGPIGQQAYFFSAPPDWCAGPRLGSREPRPFETVSIDCGNGRFRHDVPSFIPHAFAVANPCRSCVAVAFGFDSRWTCRLFVLDPKRHRRREDTLRQVRSLADELSPAVYNVYLVHRLRTRAAAIERASLARALHDGLIQSLIAAEMEVHAACRRAIEGPTVTAAELLWVERILHQEVLGVRDLMQRIKPIHLEANELCDFLADYVQKFEADTGIRTSFFADVRRVSLPSAMCTEVARIVQEALSNVRKHSGARNACVRLQEADNNWSLVIEDDGRGLAAISVDAELDDSVPRAVKSGRADGKGAPLRSPSPTVIKECVRSLDGELKLLPAAGGGLRLEISFPGRAVARTTPTTRATTITRKKMAKVQPIPRAAAR